MPQLEEILVQEGILSSEYVRKYRKLATGLRYKAIPDQSGVSLAHALRYALKDWMDSIGCVHIDEIEETESNAIEDDPYNGLQLVRKADAAD